MAITEMLHVDLLGMRQDKKKLLRLMQKAGCVQIAELDAELCDYRKPSDVSREYTEEQLTKIRWAISEMGRHANEKTGMLASMSMKEASEDALHAASDRAEELLSKVSRLESLEKQRGDLRGEESQIKARIEQLSPWQSLSIPIESLGNTKETLQMVGTMPERTREAFLESVALLPVSCSVLASDRGTAYLWLLAHYSATQELQDLLKAAGFAEAAFTEKKGTIAQNLDALNQRVQAIDAQRSEIATEIVDLSKSLPDMQLLYEHISARQERNDVAERFAETRDTFYLTGWAPAPLKDRLEKEIHAIAKDTAIHFRSATDEESPPVLLRNHRHIEPFESIVSSFSLPDPRGLDPTFVMAPFFLCFFGMMLSDAGYGIVMAILMPLAIHFLKPKTGLRKMMFILGLGGVATIFWGAMFDTWFGMSIKPMLVNPLEDPLKMMAICLGFGAVHLFAGLFVGAYMNFKRGKPLDALYDQFSWFSMIVGLGLLLLPQTATVGKWMAIGGALIITLTAARDKKNPISRIMGGLGALYGATGWLSDLLSYMRLFGMGLATGVIGMVINQLTGLIFGKNIVFDLVGVVILIGGHIFNAVINTIGAYVHASRLQYIEFFGKFYEDGGHPFSPLTHHPKYVAIRDTELDRAQS